MMRGIRTKGCDSRSRNQCVSEQTGEAGYEEKGVREQYSRERGLLFTGGVHTE